MRASILVVVLTVGCGSSSDPLFLHNPSGGAGGASATSSTSSTSGAGGAQPCTTPADCTGYHVEDCSSWACVSGACVLDLVPAGTIVEHVDQPGDCRVPTCDGAGALVMAVDMSDPATDPPGNCRSVECAADGTFTFVDDPQDPEDDGNPCTLDTCISGSTTHDPKAVGTSCDVGYCDGVGTCVECTAPAHCPSGMCVDYHCT